MSQEEIFFRLTEADNLIQAARNRLAEAAVQLNDCLDATCQRLSQNADEILRSTTALGVELRSEAKRRQYRVQSNRIKAGGAK